MDIYVIAKSGKKTSRANTGDKVFWRFDTSAEARDFISKAKAARSIYEIQELSYSRPDDAKDVYYTYEYVKNSCLNAKFKVGDFVFDRNSHRSGVVTRDADKPMVGVKDDFSGKEIFISASSLEVRNANSSNPVVANAVAVKNARIDNSWDTLKECEKRLSSKCNRISYMYNGDIYFSVRNPKDYASVQKEVQAIYKKHGYNIRFTDCSPSMEPEMQFYATMISTPESKRLDKEYLSKNAVVRNAVAWKAKNAVPTYVGRGIFKLDDVVEYSGSPWKVIAVSKLGIGNGMSKVSYGLKSVKTGVVVKDIPEHNISKV